MLHPYLGLGTYSIRSCYSDKMVTSTIFSLMYTHGQELATQRKFCAILFFNPHLTHWPTFTTQKRPICVRAYAHIIVHIQACQSVLVCTNTDNMLVNYHHNAIDCLVNYD